MAWIESHQELGRHPKTRRLARLLNLSLPATVGHLHFLWWWALDYAQDGSISRYDDFEIADGAMFEGDATQFVQALITAGFLDEQHGARSLHDWKTYAGKLIAQRKSNADRQRAWRERQSSSEGEALRNANETPGNTHRNSNITVTSQLYNAPHNSTVQYSTSPSLSSDHDRESDLSLVAPSAVAPGRDVRGADANSQNQHQHEDDHDHNRRNGVNGVNGHSQQSHSTGVNWQDYSELAPLSPHSPLTPLSSLTADVVGETTVSTNGYHVQPQETPTPTPSSAAPPSPPKQRAAAHQPAPAVKRATAKPEKPPRTLSPDHQWRTDLLARLAEVRGAQPGNHGADWREAGKFYALPDGPPDIEVVAAWFALEMQRPAWDTHAPDLHEAKVTTFQTYLRNPANFAAGIERKRRVADGEPFQPPARAAPQSIGGHPVAAVSVASFHDGAWD